MNYQRIYDAIIERAKLRGLNRCLNIKMHKHHIKMKSLYDDRKLANIKENLVLLTPKEHFICHHLLFKIFPCHETQSAYWFMGHSKTGGVLSAKQYEQLKSFYNKDEVFNKFSAINKGRTPWNKGKTKDDIKNYKKKIKISKKRTYGNAWNKGTHGLLVHSSETKLLLSELNKGERNKFYGKRRTEECKMRMSKAAKIESELL